MNVFEPRTSNLLSSIGLMALAFGCGSKPSAEAPTGEAASSSGAEGEEMESGAREPDAWQDWKSYTNVSPGSWVSNTHGKRFVEIYVNDVGLEAYKSGGEMPVGSIVVKPSWENEEGSPGAEGPLFVMVKREEGFASESGDWFYAFQWAKPVGKFASLGENVDWRSPEEKVEYCVDCHDVYDRALGMPPKERRDRW